MKFTKGHYSVISVGEVRYLFCAHCLIILYICTKFCQSISKGFRVTGPDSRIDARVVTNVDGRTDVRTDERPENRIPISRHALGRCDRNKSVLALANNRIMVGLRTCQPTLIYVAFSLYPSLWDVKPENNQPINLELSSVHFTNFSSKALVIIVIINVDDIN